MSKTPKTPKVFTLPPMKSKPVPVLPWKSPKVTKADRVPTPKLKLARLIHEMAGANHMHASVEVIQAAAVRFADQEGIAVARAALEQINEDRDAFYHPPAELP